MIGFMIMEKMKDFESHTGPVFATYFGESDWKGQFSPQINKTLYFQNSPLTVFQQGTIWVYWRETTEEGATNSMENSAYRYIQLKGSKLMTLTWPRPQEYHLYTVHPVPTTTPMHYLSLTMSWYLTRMTLKRRIEIAPVHPWFHKKTVCNLPMCMM